MIRIQKILNTLSVFTNRNDLPKSFVDPAFLVNEDDCNSKFWAWLEKPDFLKFPISSVLTECYKAKKRYSKLLKIVHVQDPVKLCFSWKIISKLSLRNLLLTVITYQVIILQKVRDVGCKCNYVISYHEIWAIKNLSILGVPSQLNFLGSFV